ncbi:MAG: histidinol dehydrogenase [Deltaproteobacteria bacterium]|nr:histidinol dehydrogenase [Deltaproteobacteria bacterium]
MKRAIERPAEDITEVETAVREIIGRVRSDGEEAVRYYSRKFDNYGPKGFKYTEEEIAAVKSRLPATTVEDIDFCQAQIRNFAELQMESITEFEMETLPGVHLGQKVIPVGSSGSYVPGGRYPMLASAHMTVITPKVAGVKRVVACSPPVNGEGLWPYGMEGLDPVDVVVGAGNVYVTEAKRQLFGPVGIDLLAGPSELLVIADDTADPAIVAADILGQSEHDPRARVALVCLSEQLAGEILREVERGMADLPTKEVAQVAWRDYGEVIVADSREEAVSVSDEWAPEHLEVHAKDWRYYLENCTNYGSAFLGEETTVAFGDMAIGTNHVLPTTGAARYTGGLSVGKFLKTVTYQYASREGSLPVARVCERACEYENLPGHANSCRVRIEKYE